MGNMTPYQVYHHVDPDTGYVVYVGIGTLDRPWQVHNRSKEHSTWLKEKYTEHGSLNNIVYVMNTFVGKGTALEIELEMIGRLRPKFNKNFDYPLISLTKEGFKKAKYLKETGNSYSTIARQLQVSAMTIYRALNKETKAYGKYE